MRTLTMALALAACALSFTAQAREHRSHWATAEFQREHPCPSTGKHTGRCPGWIKDHRIPLCKHGADLPSNMQWQTVADAKAKDRGECK